MRLRLSREGDVAVLDVLDEVGARGLEVLRAGLAKLLQSGRSRVIVSFSDARALDVALMAEIIKFHALALELDGELMLVGQGDLILKATKTAPKGASSLPRCYSTTKAALAAMGDRGSAKAAEIDYGLGDDPNGLLKKRITQLGAEYAALTLKARGLAQAKVLRELRRENGRLERELAFLDSELARVKADRKAPFRFEDLDRKVDLLARALAWLLGETGVLPKSERPRELPEGAARG